tara:strand:+ start:1050 stop:4433 length:3384 start_codon:yes stop_codon:yes gene_type:complete
MGKRKKTKSGKGKTGDLPKFPPPEKVETTPLEDEELESLISQTTIRATPIDDTQVESFEFPDAPEPEGWNPKIGKVPKNPIERIHSLGDLHGWAPGLITYLIHHQLARIEIEGKRLYKQSSDGKISVDADAIRELFPHPIDSFSQSKRFPSAGLLGQNVSSGKWEFGYSNIKAEWIGHKTDPSACFVQIGDVFDRSDHSELAAEVLRQLIIQAPLRVMVLVGNHEQFMLEDDYDNWYHNESRWSYTDKHINGERGFHTRFHPQTYGWTLKQSETSAPVDIFNMYKASTAVLYLTQACVLAEIGLRESPENLDQDVILAGGFNAYNEAMRYLNQSIESESKPHNFPGAYTTIGIGNTIFAHAEVAAFSKPTDTVLEFTTVSQKNTEIILSEYRQMGSDINSSPDFELLWQRNSSHGSTSNPPVPACAEYIQNLVSILPGVRHYVHGHTPTPSVGWFEDIRGSSIVSYVARDSTKAAIRSKSSVRIHMIDEGICPVYFQGSEGIFDPSRVPLGLQTHPNAAKFDGSDGEENIETETDEWRHYIHLEEDFVPFKVPPSLTITTPTGIGAFAKKSMMVEEMEPWLHACSMNPNTGFDGWRVLMDDYSSLENSLDILLYPSDSKEMQQPVKVPFNRGEGVVEMNDFDRLVMRVAQERFSAFVRGGCNTEDLTSLDGEKWIAQIVPEYVERLGEHESMILEFGTCSIVKSTGSIFISIQYNSDGTVQIHALNGNENDVSMTFSRLADKSAETHNISIPGLSWAIDEMKSSDQSKSCPYEIRIDFGNQPPKPFFGSMDAFTESERNGKAQSMISEDSGFTMIVWPEHTAKSDQIKSNQQPLPDWVLAPPTLETTDTIISADTAIPAPPPALEPEIPLPPPPVNPPSTTTQINAPSNKSPIKEAPDVSRDTGPIRPENRKERKKRERREKAAKQRIQKTTQNNIEKSPIRNHPKDSPIKPVTSAPKWQTRERKGVIDTVTDAIVDTAKKVVGGSTSSPKKQKLQVDLEHFLVAKTYEKGFISFEFQISKQLPLLSENIVGKIEIKRNKILDKKQISFTGLTGDDEEIFFTIYTEDNPNLTSLPISVHFDYPKGNEVGVLELTTAGRKMHLFQGPKDSILEGYYLAINRIQLSKDG